MRRFRLFLILGVFGCSGGTRYGSIQNANIGADAPPSVDSNEVSEKNKGQESREVDGFSSSIPMGYEDKVMSSCQGSPIGLFLDGSFIPPNGQVSVSEESTQLTFWGRSCDGEGHSIHLFIDVRSEPQDLFSLNRSFGEEWIQPHTPQEFVLDKKKGKGMVRVELMYDGEQQYEFTLNSF